MKKKFLNIILLSLAGLSLASCGETEYTSKEAETSSSQTKTREEITSTEKNIDVDSIVYNQAESNYNIISGIKEKYYGSIERNVLSSFKDNGLSSYPKYGQTYQTDLVEALKEENKSFLTGENTYDEIDEQGNLLLRGEKTGNKMFKHTASKGLYSLNDNVISDDEKAIIKEITYDKLNNSNYITGLYAAPGEIVKIEISSDDLAKINSLNVYVGQSYSNDNSLDNDSTSLKRMPYLTNKFNSNKTVFYVANPLGGPIYLDPECDESFTVKISGALEYAHFIYGITSEFDYKRLLEKSCPYFDAQIGKNLVRFACPKYAIEELSYSDINETLKLFAHFHEVAKSISRDDVYDTITLFGDIEQNNYSLTPQTIAQALNYKKITSNGTDSNLTLFNKRFSNFGIFDNTDINTQVLILLEYLMFTNVSQSRQNDTLNEPGNGIGLDPKLALQGLNGKINGQSVNDVSFYSNIIYSFGPNAFVKAISYMNEIKDYSPDSLYDGLAKETNYSFVRYFKACGIKLEKNHTETNEFIPIASTYQAGYENFNVLSNYLISSSKNKLDFSNIEVLKGYNYSIESLTDLSNGTLEKINDSLYYYTPSKAISKLSLKVNVTDNLGFSKIITLPINLEKDKNSVELNTYTYSEKPTDFDVTKISSEYIPQGYTYFDTKLIRDGKISKFEKNTLNVFTAKFTITKSASYTFAYYLNKSTSVMFYSINSQRYNNKIYISSNQSGYLDNESSCYLANLKKGDVIYIKCYSYTSEANTINIGLSSYGTNKADGIKNMNLVTNMIGEEGNESYDFVPNYEFNNKNTVVDYANEMPTINLISEADKDNETIKNIFDNSKATYFKSNNNVDENNKVIFNISNITSSYNMIDIVGLNNNRDGLIKDIDIFDQSGNKLNYSILYTNTDTLTIRFSNKVNYSTLKIEISSVYGSKLYISDIKFGILSNVLGASDFAYKDNSSKATDLESIYGYSYDLSDNSVKFEFEGTSCKVLFSSETDISAMVTIDSNKQKIVIKGELVLTDLANSKHVITITPLCGYGNIQSVFYN